MAMAVILLSKCKHFTSPLFPILECSIFSSATGISAGTGVSLSALTKAFQGRETNFCEHGKTIRPALFNLMHAAADPSQRGVNSCYQQHHVIIVTIFISASHCQMAPSRLIITVTFLFVMRLILLQPRYLARVLLFL